MKTIKNCGGQMPRSTGGELMGARTLNLPYPPSVNRYWRRAGQHMHISHEGRAYRDAVVGLTTGCEMLTGPLSVEIKVLPPDNRRRDLDNVLKALLDALAHGGVYDDDSQIVRLLVERCDVVADGEIWVRVSKVE